MAARGDAQAALPASIERLKTRGWRGGIITPHRAFAQLQPRAADYAGSVALMVGFALLWAKFLPRLGTFWGAMLGFWAKHLNLGGTIVMVPQNWASLRFALPFVNVPAGPITPRVWVFAAAITFLIFAGTYFMGDELLPWRYIIRALILIQATALVYFAFFSARFPHDLPTYTVGMLSFGVILIGLVAPILAFTYYLFDFSFAKKLGLTVLAIVHLTLFIPLQYMLHVYVLCHSILFMPLLYFAFGPFLDVLVFVSFYSWGMSWRSASDVASDRPITAVAQNTAEHRAGAS